MINPFLQINWMPDNAEIKKFGRSILIGLLIIGFLIGLFSFYRTGATAWRPTLILPMTGIIVFILSSLAPKAALPLYYIWFLIAACIGIVISNILLTAFYYLFFSPFSVIIHKLSGYDPLKLKKNIERKTYWFEHKPRKDLKSYYKQY